VISLRTIVLIGISVSFMACTASKVVRDDSAEAGVIEHNLADADSFWDLRADTSFAYRSLLAYQDLAEKDTLSIVLWSKLSRAYYYCGQFMTGHQLEKDSLFMKGYEASQNILAKDTEYYNLLFSTGDEHMAVRGLDAQYLDILYWGMANYGRWLETKGELVRLGQRDLIWTRLEHIHDLDSNYYNGAYYRFKGALMTLDPGSISDTLAIKTTFETAIAAAPDYLGNYTFMALYYCPLVNDKDLFYRLLTTVITMNNTENLPYYPENLLEKRRAEQLMINAEKGHWF
jgi:hypothetical protein